MTCEITRLRDGEFFCHTHNCFFPVAEYWCPASDPLSRRKVEKVMWVGCVPLMGVNEKKPELVSEQPVVAGAGVLMPLSDDNPAQKTFAAFGLNDKCVCGHKFKQHNPSEPHGCCKVIERKNAKYHCLCKGFTKQVLSLN